MTYSIRPAKRSEAKPLIGLYAESGAGKTWSALLLARGFVGPTGKIVQIETESGRGEAYADLLPGGYDVISMRDNFSPANFGEAIDAAEKATAEALVIDSASMEWEGDGGVLAMASENEEAGKKGMSIWTKPKLEHARHFMLRVLSTPIPLVVLCMRARYPMEEVILNGKRTPQRSTTLVPYQSDKILFELFVHGWIDQAHRFHGTKYSRDDLRLVFRDNEPISLETGQQLAAWAKGGTTAASRSVPSDTDLGATSGGGSGGAPTPDEILATDFAERFDEVTTVSEGKEWSARWDKARASLAPALQAIGDAARQRARARLQRKGGKHP